jgi:hypothetical protein
VATEELPAAANAEEDLPETREEAVIDNTPPNEQIGKYLTQERLYQRRVKAEKYKKLLEGNI